MNQDKLKNILESAAYNLFRNQPNIFEFTSETGQTEWNLAHHLANEIHKLLPNYDCDLDVTKRSYDNRRPDIIFHKRGTNHYNLLVIEVKRDGSAQDLNDDIQKIKNDWVKEPLHYQFGAMINLKSDASWGIKVFKNESQ